MLIINLADLQHNFPFFSVLFIVVGIILIAAFAIYSKKSSKPSLVIDILRDVGIAFLVASIVTFLYELHARTAFDTERMNQVLNTVLKYNVPENVWGEVNKNVLQTEAIRRNVNVQFEVKKDSILPDRAFLRMKYEYDLYSLMSNSAQIKVQHDIGGGDFNNLALFEEWHIINSQNTPLGQFKIEEGKTKCEEGELNCKGFNVDIHLEPGYDLKKEEFIKDRAIHVSNLRREVINLPGTYTLGIPVLMEGTSENPIKVTVSISQDIPFEPVIDTQWEKHNFNLTSKQGTTYVWEYTGVLLPGQFFNIRFDHPKPQNLNKSP